MEGRTELSSIQIDNCFIDLVEPVSSEVLWITNKNGKKYVLISSQIPHCGDYRASGECCGGDDTYWYFYEIDKDGNAKKINKQILYANQGLNIKKQT